MLKKETGFAVPINHPDAKRDLMKCSLNNRNFIDYEMFINDY